QAVRRRNRPGGPEEDRPGAEPDWPLEDAGEGAARLLGHARDRHGDAEGPRRPVPPVARAVLERHPRVARHQGRVTKPQPARTLTQRKAAAGIAQRPGATNPPPPACRRRSSPVRMRRCEKKRHRRTPASPFFADPRSATRRASLLLATRLATLRRSD